MIKSVLITGAGAIGLLLAAKIKSSGVDAYLLGKNEESIRPVVESGIKISDSLGEREVKIDAFKDPTEVPRVDLAIIAVKAYDTLDAGMSAKKAVAEGGLVLTLQNGLGNVETLQNIFGACRVIAGVTSQGANTPDFGKVVHAGEGETVIGSPAGKALEAVSEARKLLEAAGFKTRISENIESEIWGKLIVNAGVNPVATIFNIPNGEILRNVAACRLMELAVEEAVKVATLAGVKLPYDNAVEHVKTVIKNTAGNICSMLADIRKGRKTEIEQINGAIAKAAEAHSFGALVNASLVDIVQTMTRERRRLMNMEGA